MALTFDRRSAVPSGLSHRVRVLGGSIDASNLNRVEQTYDAASLAVSPVSVPLLGPPLRGSHWVGNSGNSSAPHLHFHVMDGPSVLGSNGLPFVIDRYVQSGRITDAMVGASGIGSDFSAAVFTQAAARASSLPLDQAVVDF